MSTSLTGPGKGVVPRLRIVASWEGFTQPKLRTILLPGPVLLVRHLCKNIIIRINPIKVGTSHPPPRSEQKINL